MESLAKGLTEGGKERRTCDSPKQKERNKRMEDNATPNHDDSEQFLGMTRLIFSRTQPIQSSPAVSATVLAAAAGAAVAAPAATQVF